MAKYLLNPVAKAKPKPTAKPTVKASVKPTVKPKPKPKSTETLPSLAEYKQSAAYRSGQMSYKEYVDYFKGIYGK